MSIEPVAIKDTLREIPLFSELNIDQLKKISKMTYST